MASVSSILFGRASAELKVQQKFDENSMLEGLVAALIIPSVKRREMTHRELGLISLGLCCLIAKVRGTSRNRMVNVRNND